MRLRRSKFAFRLRRANKNASRQFKICVSPARNTRSECFPCAGPHKTRLWRSKFAFQNAPADLGRTVFPAQGHTKRVSGGQNLRFACAGAQNRMLRMLRHESETWILQSFLRYIWMLRHGSGVVDLAEDPEIQRC